MNFVLKGVEIGSNPLDCDGILNGSHMTFSVTMESMNYGKVTLKLGYSRLVCDWSNKFCQGNRREQEIFVKILYISWVLVWQVYQHPYCLTEMRMRETKYDQIPGSGCLDSVA